MATPQLQTAIKAALNAGKIISRESLRVDTLEVHEKTQFDFFSRVDTDCQEEICRTIIPWTAPRISCTVFRSTPSPSA